MRRLAAIALILVVAACSAPGGAPSAAPSGSASAQAGHAEHVDGAFRLTFTLPRTSWTTSESIEGESRLEPVAEGAVVNLSGSGGGLLAFAFSQVDGPIRVEPAWAADCAPHRLAPDAPMVSPIKKSGGYSDSQPDAAFYRAFFADPLVRLPAGEWGITAIAVFTEGLGCQGVSHSMSATIRVVVTEGPA